MSYSIIRGDIQRNRNDLILILKRNLSDFSESRYHWSYEDCPYGEADYWLAKDESSGVFVGAGSLFPRRFFLNGHVVSAGIVGDFAVDRSHRGYGPAIKIQKTIQGALKEKGLTFIYGLPNKLSESIFLRVGYTELGTIRKFVRIVNAEQLLEDYLHVRPFFPLRMLCKVADQIIGLLSRDFMHRKDRHLRAEATKPFDKRFDVLWEKACSNFPVLAQRKSDYLNWRYIEAPHTRFRVFTITKDHQEVLGFIAYYVNGLRCHIADLLCMDAGPTLELLLLEFVAHMKKEKVSTISIRYLGERSVINALKRVNSWPRKEKQKVVVYPNAAEKASRLLKEGNWYFLIGDRDL